SPCSGLTAPAAYIRRTLLKILACACAGPEHAQCAARPFRVPASYITSSSYCQIASWSDACSGRLVVRSLHDYVRLVAVAVVLTAAAYALGTYGWPTPDRTVEFSVVVLAAVLTSGLATAPAFAEDRGLMAPYFIADLGALLFLGGNAALLA